ncbi:serine/arginine repetitive matrix protein 1-like isoform X2 [Plodia interpunctella]|uniref:serine/arginine repetitive matrix protein 1-like isoform X2 n=1 Tax=Plodia interpunctella TaxID=58824 RepID=UPI00236881C6|nr:serine/arginine repetitive matrix protein 1-like isoform X2 [Plodia interpunctella]
MALRTTLESIARLPGPGMRVGCRGVRSAPVGEPPCTGPPPARLCPCEPQPRPPCRARPKGRVEALKVTCCPPVKGPCPPCLSNQPLNCNSRKLSSRAPNSLGDSTKSCIPNEPVDRCRQTCGNENDRVERRLAAEERVRREQYEQEVAERSARGCEHAPAASYCLGLERECARATDGRQYAVLCSKQAVPKCGPGRQRPPPQCVELLADDNCKIQGGPHMDPCAHRRRTILQIDRSQTNDELTAFAMQKSVDGPGVTVSKQPCDKKCDEKSCEMKRSTPPQPPPCRLPSVTETLRARGSKPNDQSCPTQARSFHTSARNTQINVKNILKTRKNQFSTNKLISSSSPDIKIITFNRATSPLVKKMSANNCGGNTKPGSWTSFEKLRKICQNLGKSKKNEKILNMSSTCKMPPPCVPPIGAKKQEAQRVPPNPCAPNLSEKDKEALRNTCSSKKTSTNSCPQKKPNLCGQKPQMPFETPNPPCREKRPSSPCGEQKSSSPCGQNKPNTQKAKKMLIPTVDPNSPCDITLKPRPPKNKKPRKPIAEDDPDSSYSRKKPKKSPSSKKPRIKSNLSAKNTQNTSSPKNQNSSCGQNKPNQSTPSNSPPPCQPCGTPRR